MANINITWQYTSDLQGEIITAALGNIHIQELEAQKKNFSNGTTSPDMLHVLEEIRLACAEERTRQPSSINSDLAC
jgi:hypothetical protein